jgi:hypothetical protein
MIRTCGLIVGTSPNFLGREGDELRGGDAAGTLRALGTFRRRSKNRQADRQRRRRQDAPSDQVTVRVFQVSASPEPLTTRPVRGCRDLLLVETVCNGPQARRASLL